MSDQTREYVTIQEAADMLGVHYHTIRNHIIKGGIKAVKVGVQWRIKKTDLERYLHASVQRED